MLAVSGNADAGGRAEPTGLMLVDIRTWSIRTLDLGIDTFTVSQGRIVASGPRAGLAVFDNSGRLLYRRFGGWTTWVNVVHRGHIYATAGGKRRIRVLELGTGKQLGWRPIPPPRLLIEDSG